MAGHFRKLSWGDNLASINSTNTTKASKAYQNEKLQAINERIMAISQLKIMRNRVNQLQKAKEFAEQDIFQAKLKIKKIKKTIKQKEENLIKKNEIAKAQKDYEDRQREKFTKERTERQNNIRRFEKRIMKYNKTIADDYKIKSKQWDELMKNQKIKDAEFKVARRKEISQYYSNSLKLRTISQRDYREKLRDEYSHSIQTEREIQEKAIKEIAELEQVEAGLLEDFSKTMEMRNNYIENLNNLKSG